jgi:hypothetical protein
MPSICYFCGASLPDPTIMLWAQWKEIESIALTPRLVPVVTTPTAKASMPTTPVEAVGA